MPLFVRKDFISAAGLPLRWKIECDALTAKDWAAIADICGPLLPTFGRVIGIPRGGLQLAREIGRYCRPSSPVTLMVDDVWTTGQSMTKAAEGLSEWIGFVAFARGSRPAHVRAFMETRW